MRMGIHPGAPTAIPGEDKFGVDDDVGLAEKGGECG